MSYPYGSGPPIPPIETTPNSGTASTHRRLSYATVAAGVNLPSPYRRGSSMNNSGGPASREPSDHLPSRGMDAENGVGVTAGHRGDGSGAGAGAGASGRRSTGTGGVTSAAWASDSLRFGMDPLGNSSSTHDVHQHLYQQLFTPSYLKKSRHAQRLRHAYERYVADLQDSSSHRNSTTTTGNPTSLSASSSSVSLSKIATAHAHRGVMQDIVERLQSPLSSAEEEKLGPLPSRWNDNDKMSGVDIMADGTEVRFSGVTKTTDEAAAVRSNHPMPKECGIFYFEVTVLSRGKEGWIGIGFSSRKANLNRLPGWEADSWAYHGDDGMVFACTASGKAYGPRFAAQDVIGCGMNFRTGSAFFTKNGNFLGMSSFLPC